MQQHPHSRLPQLPQHDTFQSFPRQPNDSWLSPSAQGQHDESLQDFQVTAMAGWPEMVLEEVGHADKFKPWKKRYDEYVSKCTDKQRTPATIAQCFSKWANWFATSFTEQEKQRHEQENGLGGGMAAFPTFRARDVLALTDSEFTRRYLAFCQVRIKEPSQVLQLLSTPKIDASTGGLVELMQAAQSFSEQLQLIPKSALAQCQPSQIREAFITSIFGYEQLRERKVDYLKCHTWEEACEVMIRKASGAGGVAFQPFKTLKELSKSKQASDKPSVDKEKEKGKEAERSEGPDMSTKAEQKWKARFQELATEYSIRSPKHAFASSWKVRYAYLLDCVSKDSKCRRCRSRGHLPSSCDDPLPEVPYPTLSAEHEQELKHLRLVSYDQNGNSRSQEPFSGRQSDHQQERGGERSRGYAGGGRGGGSQLRGYDRDHSHGRDRDYDRNRSHSRDREQDRGHQPRDDRQDGSRSYDRDSYTGHREYSHDARSGSRAPDRDQREPRTDERMRDSSRDRRPPEGVGDRALCFRCARPGHTARDCESDTHADGHALQPRNSSSRSPVRSSPQSNAGQQRR
jgi:hypothetical protein